MKTIHKVIRDDLFERDIHLFVGSGKQLEASGLVSVVDIDSECSVAVSFHYEQHELIWINADINRDMLRSLVHESVHVAVYIMSQCGVPQGEDNNEMVARYTEYLVGSFVDYLPTKGRIRR
jgi:hypothetical protein